MDECRGSWVQRYALRRGEALARNASMYSIHHYNKLSHFLEVIKQWTWPFSWSNTMGIWGYHDSNTQMNDITCSLSSTVLLWSVTSTMHTSVHTSCHCINSWNCQNDWVSLVKIKVLHNERYRVQKSYKEFPQKCIMPCWNHYSRYVQRVSK